MSGAVPVQSEVTPASLRTLFHDVADVKASLIAQGASPTQIAKTITGMVRDRWPCVRTWRYLCDDCADSGWWPRVCTAEARCGRPFTLPTQRDDDSTGRGTCGVSHDYVTPCHCLKGRHRRDGLHHTKHEDDFTKAGKVAKPLSRFGR